MSKRQLLCLLGVWIMVFLFLGFRSEWDKVIAVVTGLVIVGIAYTLPEPVRSSENRPETFVDNNQR